MSRKKRKRENRSANCLYYHYSHHTRHIHVSNNTIAKAKQERIESRKRYLKGESAPADPEEPPRVHIDGHPNRPPPERPKRGRMSQGPNRKAKLRGPTVGDLFELDEEASSMLAMHWMISSGKEIFIIESNRSSYSSEAPKTGAYIFMGIFEPDVDIFQHPHRNYWLMSHGMFVFRVSQAAAKRFRKLLRFDKIKA